MKRLTLMMTTVMVALTVVGTTAVAARADGDGDAKQDKRVLHAVHGPGRDLGGNKPNGKRKASGWGANACQATGWQDPLQFPVAPHTEMNHFNMHVRWCLNDGKFTKYSAWPENGPSTPWTHWIYKGLISHVINTYNDRIYARFTAQYEACLAWIIPYCVDKNATIHITVYSYNKAPSEGGQFSDTYYG